MVSYSISLGNCGPRTHLPRYLFEVADFEHLSRVLTGGLRCCGEIYQQPSESIIYSFLQHIAGNAEEGKGNFPEAKKRLLLAEKSRRSRLNHQFPIEDDLVAAVNCLGLVYNSMNQFSDALHCVFGVH